MPARTATDVDVEAISRICSDGYRRTYPELLSRTTIEDAVARYYRVDRIRGEVRPDPPAWSGYLVAEDDRGDVTAAGAGGLTAEGAGEVYVLYVDPERRGQGFGTAVLDLLTHQQVDAGARVQRVSVTKGKRPGDPVLRGSRLRRRRGGGSVGRHGCR